MDFEMEDFFFEPLLAEEFDIDYEFDAAKYYDFTRKETELEIREAERWFETAGYTTPPRRESIHRVKSLPRLPPSERFNFMNPTASQLAKQNFPSQIECDRLLSRSQKFSKDEVKSSRVSSVNESQATKRQKLEDGYLSKAACLKHQALFSHKTPKTARFIDVHRALAKPKVTIPREPNLETALRAERRRSKISLESVESTKPDAFKFKARPLNRKILEAPSVPLPKKSTPQVPEFQVFHFRTLERATTKHRYSNNGTKAPTSTPTQRNETISSRRVNHVAAVKEKVEPLERLRARCLIKKDCNFSTDKSFSNELPIESFSKLSLAPELHSSGRSRSKENAPGSLHLEHEIKYLTKVKRPSSNQFQCGSNQPVPSIIPQVNSRRLDIR